MVRWEVKFRIYKQMTDSNKMETVSGGMGLSNIRDRVKALGGTVQITQEKGFRIFVTIPKSVSN